MSSVRFHCKHCRATSQILANRLVNATFIRCDSCMAVSSVSESQVLTMLGQAIPTFSPPNPNLRSSRR